MEHYEGVDNKNLEVLDAHEKIATCADDLLPVIEIFKDKPWDNDPILKAFYEASLEVISTNQPDKPRWQNEWRDSLDFTLKNRPKSLKVQVAVNILQRFMQMVVLEKDPHYPSKEYEKPAIWLDAMEHVVEDFKSKAQLISTFFFRDIQSNLPDRFAPIKLVALSEKDHIGPEPTYLEVGCSTQQGQSWLQSGKPAQMIDVLVSNHSKDIRNSALSNCVNLILNQEFRLGNNWGVDPIRPEGANGLWKFSCSFRPHELYDNTRKELWKYLAENKDDSVKFYEGDFSPGIIRDLKDRTGLEYFNIVALPTVLYQMSDDERQEKIDLGKSITHPENGLLIVQDFAYVDTNDPSKLRFFPLTEWKHGTYRTFIADPREDFKIFYEVFRFDSGRARQLILGKDFGRLAICSELAIAIKDEDPNASKYLNRVKK